MMAAGVLERAGQADSAEAVMRRARAAAPDDAEMDFHEATARVLQGSMTRPRVCSADSSGLAPSSDPTSGCTRYSAPCGMILDSAPCLMRPGCRANP